MKYQVQSFLPLNIRKIIIFVVIVLKYNVLRHFEMIHYESQRIPCPSKG